MADGSLKTAAAVSNGEQIISGGKNAAVIKIEAAKETGLYNLRVVSHDDG